MPHIGSRPHEQRLLKCRNRPRKGAIATIGRIDIRLATPDDVENVLALLTEAAEWTASIGFANWPVPLPRTLVTRAVAERELHVVERDESIIATLTLQWADLMFWGPREADAGYVHRLAVRRDCAGTGLGAALVAWAVQQVWSAGRGWLRLDASADNLPLCSYYERLGFAFRGDREGDFTEPDGSVRHWRTRRYERECHEEQRT